MPKKRRSGDGLTRIIEQLRNVEIDLEIDLYFSVIGYANDVSMNYGRFETFHEARDEMSNVSGQHELLFIRAEER